MDFALSDTQREIGGLVERIYRDNVDQGRLKALHESQGFFDDALWGTLAENGVLGLAIGQEHGGMGLDFETLALVIELSGKHMAPAPLVPVLVLGALPLQKFADAATRDELLPAVVKGEILLTAAWGEFLNEDPRAAKTRATETPDGWRLTGAKTGVPLADRAERVWLAARTNTGIGIFLLSPAAQGVTVAKQATTTGESQFEMALDGAPASLVCAGAEAESFIRFAWQHTAAAYSALATGMCEAMTQMAAAHTSEREAFGRPIATFQAVAHQAANCFIDTECLRGVTQQAVCLLSQGEDAEEEAMVAKIWAGDALHRVSHTSQQIHGGIGLDRDYPLFRYALWAKQIELTMGGTSALLAQLGKRIAENEINKNAA